MTLYSCVGVVNHIFAPAGSLLMMGQWVFASWRGDDDAIERAM